MVFITHSFLQYSGSINSSFLRSFTKITIDSIGRFALWRDEALMKTTQFGNYIFSIGSIKKMAQYSAQIMRTLSDQVQNLTPLRESFRHLQQYYRKLTRDFDELLSYGVLLQPFSKDQKTNSSAKWSTWKKCIASSNMSSATAVRNLDRWSVIMPGSRWKEISKQPNAKPWEAGRNCSWTPRTLYRVNLSWFSEKERLDRTQQ
jgi:hypothetical protein